MKEMIKKWTIFINDWNKNSDNWVEIYNEFDQKEKRVKKPTFYDFMQYLASRIEP